MNQKKAKEIRRAAKVFGNHYRYDLMTANTKYQEMRHAQEVKQKYSKSPPT